MITIGSDRLRVEISEPNERPNDRTRFERAGYISGVVLDGNIRFTANEPKNLFHPPTGGCGLCCEYRTDYSQDAQVGEYFPKFGVGLIRKVDNQPYLFYRKYEDVKPFPVEYRSNGDSAEFVTQAIPCMGVALETQKVVRVVGNRIEADMTARNMGDKPIELIEFCHNFISIDGMALGPSYRVELPNLKDFGIGRMKGVDGQDCSLRGNGKGFTYCEYSGNVSHIAVDCVDTAPLDRFTWRISNDAAKAYVEATESYWPHEMELWSIDHILSPEVFQCVLLEPGRQHSWQRTWTFDNQK